MTPEEARALSAFRSPRGPEVFHSIQYKNDVWRVDPFDVEAIHAEARDVFTRLVERAVSDDTISSGRILLLLGESGAGKTHLMRAFRNEVHGGCLGFFAYMQLTSRTDNYARYILRNVIESLDKPYFEPNGSETGLMRLSNAFAERPKSMRKTFPDQPDLSALTALREVLGSSETVVKLVNILAEMVVREPGFDTLDIDLVRSLLYLQSGDPLLKHLVIKYLRCEDLTNAEREVLGGLSVRKGQEASDYLLQQLGHLIHVVTGSAMVLCVDQLEDVFRFDESEHRFRLATAALRSFADNVPNSVVVISCLDDYYLAMREALDKATRDRLETEPKHETLKSARSQDEVYLIAEKRLSYLYDSMGVRLGALPTYYPFTPAELDRLSGLRTRDVLQWLGARREELRTGASKPDTSPPSDPGPVVILEQAWNDHVMASPTPHSLDFEGAMALVKESLEQAARELPSKPAWTVERVAHGASGHLRVTGAGETLAIRLCDKRAQGGALARELAQFEGAARGCRLVILRSTAFPSNPKTEIAKTLGQLLAKGATRFQVELSEWHAMAALRTFERSHGTDPHYLDWLKHEQPLTRQPFIQGILNLLSRASLDLEVEPSTVDADANDEESTPGAEANWTAEPLLSASPGALTPDPSKIEIGASRGIASASVVLDPEELKQHAAFLGGSGSGKTTAALALIEELIVRGIPAVLIDRKGDLCNYARPEARRAAPNAPFWRAVDVALYTPGDSRGRDLAIPLVPVDAASISSMSSIERDILSSYCADALAGMMDYRSGARDQAGRGILKKAVEVLLELAPTQEISAQVLQEFIASEDPALLNAVGNLDSRHFKKLTEDLTVILMNKGRLLKSSGARMTPEALFGLGSDAAPGKTRLSIISTKFIGDLKDIEFWVAQFLICLGRWASRAPSSRLQGVLFFDEADVYLPAQRKPSTKGPMEDLLKRARSAGLGILLATQSPGDLDYKCRDNIRTWFLGRIKEETALRKMKPMLNEMPGDPVSSLPTQGAGEFQVARDGQLDRIRTKFNLVHAEQVPEDDILAMARVLQGR